MEIPLGYYITGFRTHIDEELEKITRLDFLLGGEESTYLDRSDLVFGSTNASNWTYEWPTERDLNEHNIRTIKDEFTLTGISYKASTDTRRLEGLKLNYKAFETSWFQTSTAQLITLAPSIAIGLNETIKYISMQQVQIRDDIHFTGMSFMQDKFTPILGMSSGEKWTIESKTDDEGTETKLVGTGVVFGTANGSEW